MPHFGTPVKQTIVTSSSAGSWSAAVKVGSSMREWARDREVRVVHPLVRKPSALPSRRLPEHI